jgi:hypothetical protein
LGIKKRDYSPLDNSHPAPNNFWAKQKTRYKFLIDKILLTKADWGKVVFVRQVASNIIWTGGLS